MKLLIILSLLFTAHLSFAKLSTAKLSDFAQICHAQKRNQKNYQMFCECYKENVRWLINDEDMDLVEQIVTGQLGAKELKDSDNGDSEYAHMLVDIETSCAKDIKYIAPKAKRLKAEVRR